MTTKERIASNSVKPSANFCVREGYHTFRGDGGSVEVFYQDGTDYDPEGEAPTPGWYWWVCSPGCLPDSEAYGPFNSSTAAWRDARDA